MLFDLIKTHFASLMESRYLALSFEIAELHPTLNLNKTTCTRCLNKFAPASRPDDKAQPHPAMPQDIAMFDKHTHTLIAQRLDQAENSANRSARSRWITRRSPSKTLTRCSVNGFD